MLKAKWSTKLVAIHLRGSVRGVRLDPDWRHERMSGKRRDKLDRASPLAGGWELQIGRELAAAIVNRDYVRGFTHNFYRYPARFAPGFARAAIEAFTDEDDTVLDPFVGGGTSVVEALAAGRRAIGADLNSLAVFVSRAKTTPLSRDDRRAVDRWLATNVSSSARHPDVVGRFVSLAKDVPVHLRHLVAVALDASEALSARARRFARCALLRTAQWALDCREFIPTRREFSGALVSNTRDMLDQLESFGIQAAQASRVSVSRLSSCRRLLCTSAANITATALPAGWRMPRLVVTSPPYVGVNALYNRWQVRGRRETTFPYGIAGTADGHPASHYTFVHRSRPVEEYVPKLVDAFSAVRRIVASDALVVQLVAFSDPRQQLPRFLEAMEKAGFAEDREPGARRLWREVPNRKWYNRTAERPESASREVLLLHRPASQ